VAQLFILSCTCAIEKAVRKGWHNLWLWCDSESVIQDFCNTYTVYLKSRNRWHNCLYCHEWYWGRCP